MAPKKRKKFNGEGKRLSFQVAKSMQKYFKELDGERATNIYDMVLKVFLHALSNFKAKSFSFAVKLFLFFGSHASLNFGQYSFN